MIKENRPFDIIVYGATGFTGALVARYLAERGHGYRWAIAGRDQGKLEALARRVGKPDLPIFAADAEDQAGLDHIAAQTRLVIATAGPFILYGSGVVSACARHGTDYVNISGEPAWARQMVDAHEADAKLSGARIMLSAGFDSIPFELGVRLLQDRAIALDGQPLKAVSTRVRRFSGALSGGTISAGRVTREAASDPDFLAMLLDPFVMTPGFAGPKQPVSHKVRRDEALNTWLAPFLMATINSRNIHRSNLLQGFRYGEGFLYDEMAITGPGDEGRAKAEAIAGRDWAADPDAPQPGEGPSEQEMLDGFFEVLIYGTTQEGQLLKLCVKGERDPGYYLTSRMVVETGMLLLASPDRPAGGIWVPGAALGEDLQAAMEKIGISFVFED